MENGGQDECLLTKEQLNQYLGVNTGHSVMESQLLGLECSGNFDVVRSHHSYNCIGSINSCSNPVWVLYLIFKFVWYLYFGSQHAVWLF